MNDREPVDPALDAMLRDHAAETPPAHVDAAILAAAHRAVASPPRASSRRHWRLWLPLAAAATVTAVVIGLQGVEPQAPEITPATTVPPKAAPGQSGATPDQSNAATPAAKLQSPAAEISPQHPARSSTPPPPRRDEAAGAAAAPPAAAPPALTQASPSAREAPRAAASAHRVDEARVMSAPALQDARVAETIERIRSLRRDGREAEAVATLERLRETVSDADSRLPPDLRAWASTVRQ